MKNLSIICIFFFAGLLSCQNAEKQETDTNDPTRKENTTQHIVSESVTYSTDSTEMQGTIFYNENATEKSPGILVVHEWWGHNEYVKKRAEQLAELGYVAFAIDMYGKGKRAAHPEDAQKFSGEVMKNFDSAKARFSEALAVLKENEHTDNDKIGAIGYCFGGGVVLSMANSNMQELDGVVSFHGTLGLPVMPEEGNVHTKVLVLNGAEDPFVTEDQITAYKTAMDEAGADYEFISYDDAVHAFTSPAADSLGSKFDLPLAYNEQAANESWEEMKTFFNQLWK